MSAGWRRAPAPSLDEFDALARRAFDALPAEFRKLTGNVVIHVADEAERDILDTMGISDPLELSGLFEGVAITESGVSDPYALPNHVHLYRRSILDEWRTRGDISLEALVTHVLVHEIGHHFGLSDADMHRIEELAGEDS
ncbi:MAG: metallopeptidase family protein [Pseudomonadota bacterium]